MPGVRSDACPGYPTTRALSIVTSDTPVARETVEKGAMLMRIAQSHLRFGHFEHFYYRREPDKVRQLADFAIRHHWAHLQDEADKYVLWFRDVVARTASLIARWQTVGFAHGVMNTDNMSILGLTFDYGPFGFLDDYQPGYICNHSDYQGRYSFDNQPAVGLWNLQRLAQTLSPFIDVDALNDALDSYQDILLREYGTLMRNKLGLMTQEKGDNDILNGLFALMAREGSDYTRTFRMLGQTEQHSAASPLRDEFIDRQAFDDWFASYRARLQQEQVDDATRQAQMNATNPRWCCATGWRSGRLSRQSRVSTTSYTVCMWRCARRLPTGMMTTSAARLTGASGWRSAAQARDFAGWRRRLPGKITAQPSRHPYSTRRRERSRRPRCTKTAPVHPAAPG
jgi:uncharacterized protein YdiU (UPF0061 family)